MEKGQFTKDEIFKQSDAWAYALNNVDVMRAQIEGLDFHQYRQVIFTGCGSSYYSSLAAAALFQNTTGIRAKAVPGGELWMNPGGYYGGTDNFLFAISRSGSTTEVVQAAKQFRTKHAGPVFSIYIDDDRPLAHLSDLCLSISGAEEQSIAQTRAFTSMYLAMMAVTMLAAGRPDLFEEMRKLPDIGKSLLARYESYARSVGENLEIDRFYFLGSGERYGLACEGNLKMKEMTITHTEPFYFLEFRHGPISMVNETTVVVGLLSESWRENEEKVLDDARGLGAQVVSLAENKADISFESDLPENLRSVLYLPLLQTMALYRSLKKGLDPDRPRNLQAVVYLEWESGG
jgi:glucosamine--fructose-6-phosphate aminotransferase (isomerizing)